jgi:uncharacterized metal-binding protein
VNCTECNNRICRSLGECSSLSFDPGDIQKDYLKHENQRTVQSAAKLVDDGRAGNLNRLEEVIEYSASMGYKKIGIAYCWSMEKEAQLISQIIRKQGLNAVPVCCTTGGLSQSEINITSSINKVACNPLGQAAQLDSESVDLVAAVGLCMGHDMLLQQSLKAPCTTLVVKDRTSNHCPLVSIEKMIS